jgi:hypothetical protein
MNCLNKKGINLVEIMIAVGIMAFIILPIMGLLDYTNRGTREQDAEGIAANLAKEEMNRLMYVVDRDNLLSATGGGTTWSLGADHSVKGNLFTGHYTVYPWSTDELDFIVPKFKFHDPQGCSSGVESQPDDCLEAPEPKPLSEIYIDSAEAAKCKMMDIVLEVKWKLPNQDDYLEKNKFKLIGRRTFLVVK